MEEIESKPVKPHVFVYCDRRKSRIEKEVCNKIRSKRHRKCVTCKEMLTSDDK